MPQRLSDVPLAQLIPETQQWNNGQGIEILSWIGCVGSVEHAIAYGELFWPEFVELEGCILFTGFSEESYRSCLAQAGSNRQSLEALLNHRHLLDLFSGSASEPARAQLVYLARTMDRQAPAGLSRQTLYG
jgi:hypothetical protein